MPDRLRSGPCRVGPVDAGQAAAIGMARIEADGGPGGRRAGSSGSAGRGRSRPGRAADGGGSPGGRRSRDVGAPASGRDVPLIRGCFAVALLVLGLAAAGLATQPRAVQAAPTPSPPRPPARRPSRRRHAVAQPHAPPTPTPTPARSPERDGNIITDILDGIGDLFTGGRGEKAARRRRPRPPAVGDRQSRRRPAPAPRPARHRTRAGGQARAPRTPGKPENACSRASRCRGSPPNPELPRVAQTPSKLTGSKVTMTGLRFDGITDLHTDEGQPQGAEVQHAGGGDRRLPAGRRRPRRAAHQRYATDRLTVRGNVAFYATRFVGRLLGIKITLTPDLPFPDGHPDHLADPDHVHRPGHRPGVRHQ